MNVRAALLVVTLVTPALAAAQGIPAARDARPIGRSMPSFSSQTELRRFIRNLLEERARRARGRRSASPGVGAMGAPAMEMAADASGAAGESITNNQHAGVDEGGIVKLRGNHFVVLRRGRLFTIAIGDNSLTPVAAVDAFGPGINPSDAWYDEMLIAGDKVIVIGYSYGRGGTEVGVFRIGDDGSLRHQTTFHLRSNDYYSSRNYASRLIGSRLVFYTPLYLPWGETEVDDVLPAFRRWRGQDSGRFQTIVRPERVFRPAGLGIGDDAALHTVTSCDLAAAEVRCEATVVLGPAGRVFYVSGGSVYVWMASWYGGDAERPGSMLVRIPLDGNDPSAVRVAGSPVDQFSFLESDDAHLNVLTRATSRGEAMWESEHGSGGAALLRIPLARMGDGRQTAPASWYRPLVTPPGGYAFHNRFVGNYLLYGAGNGWGPQRRTDTTLYAVPWRGNGAATAVALTHGIDRIEVMGNDAVIVGAQGNNLEFTGVRLDGRPAVAQRFVMPDASQGELRSHGFFYRPDAAGTGMLGLPVREGRRAGYRHLVEGSASIVFVRNTGRRFTELGVLESGSLRHVNDNCRASCVDWYGNARPIFARGRVFALLGYEIVEGAVAEGQIVEVRRANFGQQLLAIER